MGKTHATRGVRLVTDFAGIGARKSPVRTTKGALELAACGRLVHLAHQGLRLVETFCSLAIVHVTNEAEDRCPFVSRKEARISALSGSGRDSGDRAIRAWQHGGNATQRHSERERLEQVRWRRERDSNPR